MVTELQVRGMVCERCISVLRDGLESLGFPAEKIRLGKIYFTGAIDDEVVEKIDAFLGSHGFELISSREVRLVSQVKNMVEEMYSEDAKDSKLKFSARISERLAMNYDSISKIFAEQEGMTLEKYIIGKRLVKVKELLAYTTFTLTQIAHLTGFSSVNHLSGQFRDLTGMTPTDFRSGLKVTPK